MKDLFGAACSLLCIIHCLALPLLITVGLPIAGLSLLESENTHVILSVIILIVALWAFPIGWKTHRRLFPGVLAVIGASLLLSSLVAVEAFEAYLAAVAGAALISAHLANRKLLLIAA